MKSMTGYGNSAGVSSYLDLEVSVKSINGRFLDVRFHLPREYFPFELEMKKEVSKVARRGTLDVFVQRRIVEDAPEVKVGVHKPLAKKWMAAYDELAKVVGLDEKLSLETLASIPHVLEVEGVGEVTEKEKQVVFTHVKKALANLDKERKREGAALRDDLMGHLDALASLVTDMEKEREGANKELLKKMETRLSTLQLQDRVDADRLAQEVAVLVDRADISEEILRLTEHVKAFGKAVKSTQCEGKKLDFYAQELLREANTIGSKSQVSRLTQMVVEAKTRIEKIREQVQNVE
ncbi:MAG: YicC family protein [Bdellovibrionaceae bacterium]|nr:YicC family protein [Bdellovibrionales bacterium]MCB9082887.1 YicC family protein [Pseudobdellovibrionaceae bacterium]